MKNYLIFAVLACLAEDGFFGKFNIDCQRKHQPKRRRGFRLIGHKRQPIHRRVFYRTQNKGGD